MSFYQVCNAYMCTQVWPTMLARGDDPVGEPHYFGRQLTVVVLVGSAVVLINCGVSTNINVLQRHCMCLRPARWCSILPVTSG